MADIPGIAPEELAQVTLEPGAVLAGRYTIEEQIGGGGMGAVYSAIDANTNEPVAIKLMLPLLVKNQRAQERFMDEARISQKLSHPNIVNVYDVQRDGDFFLFDNGIARRAGSAHLSGKLKTLPVNKSIKVKPCV